MLAVFIDGKTRTWKLRVRKGADRDGGDAGPALDDKGKRRPAGRAEPVGRHMAAVTVSFPFRKLAGEGDLLVRPAGLDGENGTGSFLAFKAVAGGDAHRLTFANGAQLSTSACGNSFHHDPGSKFVHTEQPKHPGVHMFNRGLLEDTYRYFSINASIDRLRKSGRRSFSSAWLQSHQAISMSASAWFSLKRRLIGLAATPPTTV